jgi:glycine oxidase
MPECLIVGGGVIGLSLAYELSQTDFRVSVIDRGPIGKVASWAGAGILPPANATTALHPLDKLRALSHRLHAEWASQLKYQTGIDTGYRQCGGLYIARSAGEVAALAGMKELLTEEQLDFERLDVSHVAELEPALTTLVEQGKLKAAYRLPDEAQLRNPDHLRALQTACAQRGVTFQDNVEAKRFVIAGRRIASIETTAGMLAADSICITSGAWSRMLLEQLGLASGIMPVRGQMVMFRTERRPFSHVINEGPRYLVPRDDGRVLVGSTEEEVGFDKTTTEAGIGELVKLAGEIIPELTANRIERTWAGLRPASFDGFPYMGRVPGLDNAFVSAGHFRSGLTLSPATAVVMSQLIQGKQPEIDLAPFSVGRG